LSEFGDREDLLLQLQVGAPVPEHAGTLVMLSEEDVRMMESGMLSIYRARRKALFHQFLKLQQQQHELVGTDACLHRLLNDLFGYGTAEIATCWQALYTIHGREYIRQFNEAILRIVRSGCVELRRP
jgi:hypothetical protein